MEKIEKYVDAICDMAYEKAKPYVEIIRNNLVCPTCHGKYHNSKCVFCEEENDDLKKPSKIRNNN